MSRVRTFLETAFDVVEAVAIPAIGRAAHIADQLVGVVDPKAGGQRQIIRKHFAAVAGTGYEAAEPSRRRRFHRDMRDGDALSRASAVPLRNQARHLDRNSDLVRGGLDKLCDFIVGGNGIVVEPQPKRADGSVHLEFAGQLRRDYEAFRKWPEVTWTHNGGSSDRLACRTWLRDGECFGQLVSGPRKDLQYGSDVPVAIEMLEPDLLPHWLEDTASNTHQGITRNAWGRPTIYKFLLSHPGADVISGTGAKTKDVPAERVLHLRNVDRIGQLRGVSVLSSVITRLQDIAEVDAYERIAAKMASSMVLNIKRGAPETFNPDSSIDHKNPRVFQMEGGMVYFSGASGESAEFIDTKRPNDNLVPWQQGQMRSASAGFGGLSYSAFSRDYNGTYSAQRQELVENWPHYHALTGEFVAQWSQPSYEEFVRWRILTKGMPDDVDSASIFDALFLGPPMPWIDPEAEANAQIMLVQAGFKSSAQVVRERGGSLGETYQQLGAEQQMRIDAGIQTSVDLQPAAVSQAKPTPKAPDPAPKPRSNVVQMRTSKD